MLHGYFDVAGSRSLFLEGCNRYDVEVTGQISSRNFIKMRCFLSGFVSFWKSSHSCCNLSAIFSPFHRTRDRRSDHDIFSDLPTQSHRQIPSPTPYLRHSIRTILCPAGPCHFDPGNIRCIPAPCFLPESFLSADSVTHEMLPKIRPDVACPYYEACACVWIPLSFLLHAPLLSGVSGN